VKQINPQVQATLEKLMTRLNELEERTVDFVVLPGCEYVIPASLTTLKLVADGTCLPDNVYYSAAMPNMKIPYPNNGQIFPTNNPYSWSSYGQVDKGAYGISASAISLKNIKHLTQLEHLTMSGLSLRDVENIGKLKHLKSLTITAAHKVVWGQNQNQSVVDTACSGLYSATNIHWVKDLPNLQTLILKGCKKLVDITVLKDMPQLRELDVRDTGVRNTDFLTNPHLKITK
jgi:Leucine-rich repeat (LRR) protein